MTLYLLDTNTISDLVRAHPTVGAIAAARPMSSLVTSAVTEGELQFGLVRRPKAARIHSAMREIMQRIEVLPWDRSAARCYAHLRADLEDKGRPLAALDMLIAAHAISLSAILVSADRAFRQVKGLAVQNWRETL